MNNCVKVKEEPTQSFLVGSINATVIPKFSESIVKWRTFNTVLDECAEYGAIPYAIRNEEEYAEFATAFKQFLADENLTANTYRIWLLTSSTETGSIQPSALVEYLPGTYRVYLSYIGGEMSLEAVPYYKSISTKLMCFR
jgi:hypothetical protein